jgi:hypothetical protein
MPGGENGSTVNTTTQHFDTVNDIQIQVVDARVWVGFHFRNSVEQGEKLGNDVADWELQQFFQPSWPQPQLDPSRSAPPPRGAAGRSCFQVVFTEGSESRPLVARQRFVWRAPGEAPRPCRQRGSWPPGLGSAARGRRVRSSPGSDL